MKNIVCLLVGAAFLLGCEQEKESSVSLFKESNVGDLAKPYVTAGNRMYCVGFQDGSFPPMGDHVKGEMGGVWTQPIKLLDQFELAVAAPEKNIHLDHLKASRFTTFPHQVQWVYVLDSLQADVVCTLFVPEKERSLQVKYDIVNKGPEALNLQLTFSGKVDLRAGFFSEQAGLQNAPDSLWVDQEKEQIVARDLRNDWFVVVSTDAENSQYSSTKSDKKEFLNPNQTTVPNLETAQASRVEDSNAVYNPVFRIENTLQIPASQKVTQSYYIAGSDLSLEEAEAANQTLRTNAGRLLADKETHYADLSKRSCLSLPDKKLETVYNWVRFNTEWLLLDVPAIGKGFGAGFAHYIWWFGTDNSYALQGLLATGDFENTKSTLRLLKKYSEKCNGNGRVIHEIVPSGAIVNPGNTQETAHFITAVWNTYLWTGDRDFLAEFYPFIKQGLNWLMVEKDTNKNLFPEGYGITEIKGLNAELIDVAVYTQQALEAGSKMAEIFEESSLQKEYQHLADQLKAKINTAFWDERTSLYCDFYGTAKDALQVVDGAIDQFKQNPETKKFYEDLKTYFASFAPDYEHGWSTNRNWVINTPIETGIAPEKQAIMALERMEKKDMTSQWGPYLSAVNKEHNMTISTGVQAVAEARYNRIDRALMHVNQIANTFNQVMPGSIAEMMPDYGCFCQEWTIYGVAVPLIQYVFGIKPNAPEKELLLQPQCPTGWDRYTLTNQRIGDSQFDMAVCSSDSGVTYQVNGLDSSWTVKLRLPFLRTSDYWLNGKKVENPSVVDGWIWLENKGQATVQVTDKYE